MKVNRRDFLKGIIEGREVKLGRRSSMVEHQRL